jgi:polysaccharide biosynthesis protein PslG
MILRLALVLLTLFLSLLVSADRPTNNCSEAWAPTVTPATVESGMGVNIHFTDPKPGEIKMIAAAGFRWVRMDLKWDITERERGQYDFSSYDRLMSELDQYKIRALFILDYGHPLYGGWPPRSEAARQAFARWAVAAARHFSNRGVIWEVYNEPNVKIFWPPRPDVDEYIALALAVGRAFRAEVPNEKLIGPAISGIQFSFLEACFKAGLLEYWSAVSVHPYRQTDPEAAANEYCVLREMIARYRTAADPNRVSVSPREIPIISGEWGYSSVWRHMDEERQGYLLARQMLTNFANGIPISIWYDWQDDGADPNDAEHHFGLVRNTYRAGHDSIYEPKPSYLAARTLSEVFQGYHFENRLAVGSKDDYVLVFAKGDDRRIATWTNSSLPRSVVIPLNGSFTFTTHNGEGKGTVTASGPGLSMEISPAPIYLTPVN